MDHCTESLHFCTPTRIRYFSAVLHQFAHGFRNDPESLQCSCWKPRSRYLIPLFPDSLVFCRYHPRSPLFRMHQPQIGIIYSSTTRDRHFEIWRCEINWFWTPRSEINTNSLHHHQIGTNFLHRHHITTSTPYRSKIGINGVLRYEIGINRVLHHKIWQK